MTNQERASELLSVLMDSEHHNLAWTLKEVLEKLRGQLSGTHPIDFTDELEVMFNNGWDECLKEIDCICDELELL
jgi:hypothetical protein